jgi:hypothetical protein
MIPYLPPPRKNHHKLEKKKVPEYRVLPSKLDTLARRVYTKKTKTRGRGV